MVRHIIRPPGFHRLTVRPESWTDGVGARVTSSEILRRLAGLGIPPAWTHVWAAEDPDSPIQAIGLDARGRTQYRYSEAAAAKSRDDKYEHLLVFAAALPALRARVASDLRARPGSPPSAETVTAAVIRLLDKGMLRVGNERYARDNHTYGVTTMRRSHVTVHPGSVQFDFVGKEHIAHRVAVQDRGSARVVGALLAQEADDDAPLFATHEYSQWRRVDSATVNSYIHAHGEAVGSAKTFRTWGATVAAVAVAAGAQFRLPEGGAARPSTLPFHAAAVLLGDTMAVARASYVHPRAIEIAGDTAVRDALAAVVGRVNSDDVEVVRSDDGFQAAVLDALASA